MEQIDSNGTKKHQKSYQKSKTLYGGVYIKEDAETIKTILWLKQ